MLRINNNQKVGQKLGTISVSIFKDKSTGLSAFSINSDEDVECFSYAIEDTMKSFRLTLVSLFIFYIFDLF